MHVVVTGVTGNVGTALVRRLACEDDVSVVGVSRRPPQTAAFAIKTWHRVDPVASGCRGRAVARDARCRCGDPPGVADSAEPRRKAMRATNVDGAMRVIAAALGAGVEHVVVASSVGAYSPGSKTDPVDESWDTGGIGTSHYSRHKAEVERRLDRLQTEHRELVISRLRPGLIFQRRAASEIARYFLGPLAPAGALVRVNLPRLPLPREFVFQAVPADDVAEAYLLALRARISGAFNVAAEPALGPAQLADIFGAQPIATPLSVFRWGAQLSWWARLQPTDRGWIDLAAESPWSVDPPMPHPGREGRRLGTMALSVQHTAQAGFRPTQPP